MMELTDVVRSRLGSVSIHCSLTLPCPLSLLICSASPKECAFSVSLFHTSAWSPTAYARDLRLPMKLYSLLGFSFSQDRLWFAAVTNFPIISVASWNKGWLIVNVVCPPGGVIFFTQTLRIKAGESVPLSWAKQSGMLASLASASRRRDWRLIYELLLCVSLPLRFH